MQNPHSPAALRAFTEGSNDLGSARIFGTATNCFNRAPRSFRLFISVLLTSSSIDNTVELTKSALNCPPIK